MDDHESRHSGFGQRAEWQVAARHGEPPAIGTDRAGKNPDQGRFPGAIGAEKPVDLARGDSQRNVIKRADAAEMLADAFGIQQRRVDITAHPRKRSSRTRNC